MVETRFGWNVRCRLDDLAFALHFQLLNIQWFALNTNLLSGVAE